MKHIVLAGPTASGKTELALALARRTGAEIISADSRQVYQRLTVGTAKPAGAWTNGSYLVEGIPYHLVDFLPPQRHFDAAAFCAKVRELTEKAPDKPFIFAGGTGMYLHAFFVGLDPLPPSDPALRDELTAFAAAQGKTALHARLAEKDPVSAAQIPPGNIQRVMRALELCLLTGKPASALKSGHFFKLPDPDKALWVCLNWEKEALNARIAARTERIFDGMAEEARTLLAEGYAETTPALKSLGYPQAVSFLKGELSRAEAVERVTALTRRYAKRQRTWFNRYQNAFRPLLNRPQDFDAERLARHIAEFWH